MDMLRYLDLFLAESREHIGAAYAIQLRLETESEDAELWREMLRHAHSLKGMAAAMGYRSMVTLAHALEERLQQLQSAPAHAAGGHFALLAESMACLGRIVDRVERGEASDDPGADELASKLLAPIALGERAPGNPAGVERATAAPEERAAVPITTAGSLESSWRIDLHLSDPQAQPTRWVVSVLRRLSTLGRVVQANPPLLAIDTGRFEGRLRLILASLLSRDRLEQELRSLVGEDSFALEAEPPFRSWVPRREARARWVRVRAEQLDDLLEGILELRLEQGRIKSKLGPSSEALREHVDRSEFQLKELYNQVKELRLVPFDSIAHRLHQAVRDLARELGKEVDFRIDGGHVRLDRLVIDALLDPLLHVLRNALDHGLEPPDEREALGKPRSGSVRLGLERHGDRVRFSVRDDGRGLHADRLKQRARDLGLIGDREAASLTDDEAWMLTTLPCFSTAKEVTHISGRGVGLDVVRASLERLGGLLQIRSRPGEGVELSLWVPPTLAVIQTLLVRCRNELYAVPLDAVERTIDLADAAGEGTPGDLRLIRLEERLGLEPRADAGSPTASRALLLRAGGLRTALVVDEVVGSRDLVVKPFHGPLAGLREYSGAALMADGSIAIVLDPFYLATGSAPGRWT